MQKIELVIFDMDGLILILKKLYLEFGLEVFRDYGHNITVVRLGTGLNDENLQKLIILNILENLSILKKYFRNRQETAVCINK